MIGRGCRTRGVCEGYLYVNTGDTEMEFMSKLKTVKYMEILDYIEFLNYMKALQTAPAKAEVTKNGKLNMAKVVAVPELQVIYEEWIKGNTVGSLKELKELMAEKKENGK
jgi:dsDNA-binding SOS-regulon protein